VITQVTKAQVAAGMDCIIVGGCANGSVLLKIRMDAQWIELSRPEYIKPLEDSMQTIPEIVNEKDTYEIHPLTLINSDKHRAIFGIGVVEGMDLIDAFSQLVTGYTENVTAKLVAAGLVEQH
jgi:hypothetical protein